MQKEKENLGIERNENSNKRMKQHKLTGMTIRPPHTTVAVVGDLGAQSKFTLVRRDNLG